MKSLRTKLADYLEVEGWEIVLTIVDDLDWWADEIWELKSPWSPEGAPAFVTFLADPMWEGDRMKGQGVWGAGVSGSLPRSRGEAEQNGTLSLRASKEEVEEFLEVMSRLRTLEGRR